MSNEMVATIFKIPTINGGTITIDITKNLKQAEARGLQKAIELLRSEEASRYFLESTCLVNNHNWSNWLESKNPYVGEKEKEGVKDE